MKNIWIWVVLAVVVLGILAYVGRHQIKSMLGMSPSQPVAQATMVPTVTPSPTATTSANALIMTKTDSVKGAYLTDAKGMTLYVFDKDTKGISNCTGSCATLWPPYTVSSGSASATMPANVTTLKRSDGSMQYAWKGMPLYYYAKDTKPGDTLGDGIGGVWHLVKP